MTAIYCFIWLMTVVSSGVDLPTASASLSLAMRGLVIAGAASDWASLTSGPTLALTVRAWAGVGNDHGSRGGGHGGAQEESPSERHAIYWTA